MASEKPKMPKLPPRYTVKFQRADKDDPTGTPGEWLIFIRGDYCDGLDEPIRSREEAIEKAWELWLDCDCDHEWREFVGQYD